MYAYILNFSIPRAVIPIANRSLIGYIGKYSASFRFPFGNISNTHFYHSSRCMMENSKSRSGNKSDGINNLEENDWWDDPPSSPAVLQKEKFISSLKSTKKSYLSANARSKRNEFYPTLILELNKHISNMNYDEIVEMLDILNNQKLPSNSSDQDKKTLAEAIAKLEDYKHATDVVSYISDLNIPEGNKGLLDDSSLETVMVLVENHSQSFNPSQCMTVIKKLAIIGVKNSSLSELQRNALLDCVIRCTDTIDPQHTGDLIISLNKMGFTASSLVGPVNDAIQSVISKHGDRFTSFDTQKLLYGLAFMDFKHGTLPESTNEAIKTAISRINQFHFTNFTITKVLRSLARMDYKVDLLGNEAANALCLSLDKNLSSWENTVHAQNAVLSLRKLGFKKSAFSPSLAAITDKFWGVRSNVNSSDAAGVVVIKQKAFNDKEVSETDDSLVTKAASASGKKPLSSLDERESEKGTAESEALIYQDSDLAQDQNNLNDSPIQSRLRRRRRIKQTKFR